VRSRPTPSVSSRKPPARFWARRPIRFPGTSDFAALLLNAWNSGANVIAFANSDADLANCLKQAKAFSLAQTDARLAD
jgi:hypothetical protein